jgi:hypothetical protein
MDDGVALEAILRLTLVTLSGVASGYQEGTLGVAERSYCDDRRRTK